MSPTPISVLISSAMTGIGAYGIIRIWLDLLSAHYAGYGIYLEIWGVATMVFGGAMALMQNDIKKVLAYSSISLYGLYFVWNRFRECFGNKWCNIAVCNTWIRKSIIVYDGWIRNFTNWDQKYEQIRRTIKQNAYILLFLP